MIVTKDAVMQEDIELIVQDVLIDWKRFQKSTILVTGAAGLIGRQIVMSLMMADEMYKLDLKVIALIHNQAKAENVFAYLLNNRKLVLLEHEISNKIEITDDIDYIIHGASITSSKAFVTNPVETIYTSINGCAGILELAKAKNIKSGVYLSSMEIYGINNKDSLSESDYGYLEHTNIRSSYSESKKMCECMCCAYQKEYQVPFVIARLTQTFGPGVEKNDNRVFAQFARSVIDKQDIVLYSKGETVRNYCYTKDAVRGILLLLLKGVPGQAYNVANENTSISIYDMACMLVETYSEREFKVRIEIEDEERHGFNPVSKTCIRCDKIKELGWMPTVGLEEMYERMIQSEMIFESN